MEVSFRYSRGDLAAVSAERFRLWLHRLRPMTAAELAVSVLSVGAAALTILGLVSFVAAGAWLGLAWPQLVGAALTAGLPCLLARDALRSPADGPTRGLVHELIFRWGWQDRLVGALRERHDRHYRRLETAGRLDLSARYVCRIEEDALLLSTASLEPAALREDRFPWPTIIGVERGDPLLLIHFSQGHALAVPRSAFADGQQEEVFVRGVEGRAGVNGVGCRGTCD